MKPRFDLPAATDYLEAERQLVESLSRAHPDLCKQAIHCRPEVIKLYRRAWMDAPTEAGAMIDAHLENYWRKPARITSERFALLTEFYNGGIEGLRCHIEREHETHSQLREAIEAAKREHQQLLADKERRRQEASKRTPEEWAQYRADYRKRRLQRAMQLMERAAQNGTQLQHNGQCFFCRRPLTDPVSQLYGIGPDCRKSLALTFGQQKASAFFELLKLNTTGGAQA